MNPAQLAPQATTLSVRSAEAPGNGLVPGLQAIQQEISNGLLAAKAGISPKYFYDELGSSLFTSICQLDEYYPTRTEAGIFAQRGTEMATEIAGTLGPIESMIDLGAGDCQKAAKLFAPLSPRRYFAVDVSEGFVTDAVRKLAAEHPGIRMQALARDLSMPWHLPPESPAQGRLFFYPGSSIGNFSPESARGFLARLIPQAGTPAALLIGVDRVKDADVLEPAYDDSLGVTAAFNLNVLNHLNRLIGADFNVRDWRHVAFFDRSHSRIEMHLEARRSVEVAWPAGARRFVAGERILTEYSYKYEPDAFAELLAAAGFRVRKSWTDEREWFGVFLALSD